MLIRKILIFLTLVSATSFAYPEFPLLWNQRVFPNDVNWMSIHIKHERKHVEKETNDPENYKVCDTKECEIIAEEFLGSMNKSIDPCDDFYDYVCGGWTIDKIPASAVTWSRFRIFRNTVYHRIKEILETKIEANDLLPIRQAKKWYRSCMDTVQLKLYARDIHFRDIRKGQLDRKSNGRASPWRNRLNHKSTIT